MHFSDWISRACFVQRCDMTTMNLCPDVVQSDGRNKSKTMNFKGSLTGKLLSAHFYWGMHGFSPIFSDQLSCTRGWPCVSRPFGMLGCHKFCVCWGVQAVSCSRRKIGVEKRNSAPYCVSCYWAVWSKLNFYGCCTSSKSAILGPWLHNAGQPFLWPARLVAVVTLMPFCESPT